MRERKKPGVMLYFELFPFLKGLPEDDFKTLVLAILEYGEYGVIPQFEDKALALVWPLVQARVKRDGERYDDIVAQRRKAAEKRWSQDGKSIHPDANASFQLQLQPQTQLSSSTPPLSPPLCIHFLKNVENSVENLWKTFVRRRCHGRYPCHTDHSLPQ